MNRNKQSGVVLVMSLIILLIVTLLGISSIQITSLQVRMTRNFHDSNLAFQSAESAIQDAEKYLETVTTLTPFKEAGANANGLYEAAVPPATEIWKTAGLWTGSNVRAAPTAISGIAAQPIYIVEFVQTVVAEEDRLNLYNIGSGSGSGRSQVFRVTTYGTGGTLSGHVLIQSTYKKQFSE